ncbi:hypothetical protein HYALB_00004294 [Hymenoscyphus albidus]|uniref:Uncharacterized protein n=1 Tax=Hymenoscyphus albidus TaxID=595503 RepID=A0A9N9LYM7_9HELO|nr:hypothetical protein HYALB_00004294 [Hymenoscyphus albidus]
MPPIDYNATYQEDFAPVPLSFPKILRTKKERKANQKDIERIEWQKNRLGGLTTQELIDLNVNSDRKLNLPNLRNPIGPTLAKRKLETRETFKIYKQYESNVRKNTYPMNVNYPLPYDGRWEANNPHVWKVLEPCLRLAQRLLMSSQTLQHTQLKHSIGGKLSKVNKALIRTGFGGDKPDLFVIKHDRNPPDPATWENEIQSRRDKLLWSYPYTFGFMNGDQNPVTDQPDPNLQRGIVHGFTKPLFDKYTIADNVLRRMAVWVSVGGMEGLFRHNPQLLPEFEVLGQQHNVAATLVHELMHVMAFAWSAPSAMPAKGEQYYFLEGLPVGERGSEWESSVFGGSSHSILKVIDRQGGGYFGSETSGWPNINNFNKDSPELESAVRQYGLRNVFEANIAMKLSFKIRTVKDSRGNEMSYFLEPRGWTETKDALTALAEELQRLTELTPVFISGPPYFYAKVTIVTRSQEEKRPLIWGQGFLSQTIARDEFWSAQHSDLMESILTM